MSKNAPGWKSLNEKHNFCPSLKRPDGVNSLEQAVPRPIKLEEKKRLAKQKVLLPNPWWLHWVLFAKFKLAMVVTTFVGSAWGSFNDIVPLTKITFERQSFDVFNWILSEALSA